MAVYPSKVLLVGEYAVLFNSEALAIPCFQFFADWHQKTNFIDHDLKKFCNYLQDNKIWNEVLHVGDFQNDLDNGVYLKSTIPMAYGLGSSGAVCAAVWDRYHISNIDDIKELQTLFQNMESPFHGKSSGLDPLISHLRQAIHIIDNEIKRIEISSLSIVEECKIYLIDSCVQREAKAFIQPFKQKMQKKENLSDFVTVWKELNQRLISSLLNRKAETIPQDWKNISKQSMIDFAPMILDELKAPWQVGIEEDTFYLKLCGAGGGGFYLSLVVDEDKFIKEFQNKYKLIRIDNKIMKPS